MTDETPPSSRPRRFARLLIPVALGAALLWQGAAFQRTTSAVWDETIYLTAGLDLYHHARVDRLVGLGIAPLPVELSYLAPAVVFGADRLPPADFVRAIALSRAAHIVLVGLPLVLLPSLWMARRRGTLAGAAVGVMLACSPMVVAFSALAVTDACFAITFLIALAALDGYVRRPTARQLALVGLAIGVALAAKYSAILLLPVALGASAWVERPRAASRLPGAWIRAGARALGKAIAVGAIALVIAWAAHGFAVAQVLPDGWDPPPSVRGPVGSAIGAVGQALVLPAPVHGIVWQILHVRGVQPAFLLGQRSIRGWWYYFPVALALKSTPAELLLAVLLPFLIWRRRKEMDGTTTLIALSAVCVVASVLSSKVNIGVRYVLVLYPLVALLAVDCIAALSGRRRLWSALLVAAPVLQIASAVAAVPGYLSYFNRIFTPPGEAYTRLVDSNLDWGQDLPALKAALDERGTSSVLLAYFGAAPPEAYGIQATAWDTPDDQAAGRQRWIAVTATLLDGVYLKGDPFQEFRRLAPDARPSESLFLYDAARPEVQRARAFARSRMAQQPCRPGATALKPDDSSFGVISHWHIRCTGK